MEALLIPQPQSLVILPLYRRNDEGQWQEANEILVAVEVPYPSKN